MPEVQKLISKSKRYLVEHTPAGATAEEPSWVQMRDYDCFLLGYVRTAGTDALTALSIVVGDTSSPGTAYVVVSHALGTAVDAVGDYVWIETNAEEIQKIAKDNGIDTDDLYVSAQVTEVGVGDKSVLLYELGASHHCQENLTADTIA